MVACEVWWTSDTRFGRWPKVVLHARTMAERNRPDGISQDLLGPIEVLFDRIDSIIPLSFPGGDRHVPCVVYESPLKPPLNRHKYGGFGWLNNSSVSPSCQIVKSLQKT
ncbi:unnamed protein product [Microthlaspi erraticum]|uniref:Uncharacterized protein n=1 Tax=Microthlaspi erraticum TaxID=1685480 RepID=A0A6D2HTM5_9BRAS|nr:unnamed protein product [Microthlaspi erraticum]